MKKLILNNSNIIQNRGIYKAKQKVKEVITERFNLITIEFNVKSDFSLAVIVRYVSDDGDDDDT